MNVLNELKKLRSEIPSHVPAHEFILEHMDDEKTTFVEDSHKRLVSEITSHLEYSDISIRQARLERKLEQSRRRQVRE